MLGADERQIQVWFCWVEFLFVLDHFWLSELRSAPVKAMSNRHRQIPDLRRVYFSPFVGWRPGTRCLFVDMCMWGVTE